MIRHKRSRHSFFCCSSMASSSSGDGTSIPRYPYRASSLTVEASVRSPSPDRDANNLCTLLDNIECCAHYADLYAQDWPNLKVSSCFLHNAALAFVMALRDMDIDPKQYRPFRDDDDDHLATTAPKRKRRRFENESGEQQTNKNVNQVPVPSWHGTKGPWPPQTGERTPFAPSLQRGWQEKGKGKGKEKVPGPKLKSRYEAAPKLGDHDDHATHVD